MALCLFQSGRGRKVNSGAAVSPRAQPTTTSSISPAPAAVPQPSPNTTTTIIVATTTRPSNGPQPVCIVNELFTLFRFFSISILSI